MPSASSSSSSSSSCSTSGNAKEEGELTVEQVVNAGKQVSPRKRKPPLKSSGLGIQGKIRRNRTSAKEGKSRQLLNLLMKPVQKVEETETWELSIFAEMDEGISELVVSLMQLGADPLFADSDGNFPLVIAMHYSRSDELVLTMIRGCQLRKQCIPSYWKQYTLADVALIMGSATILKFLMDLGHLPSAESKSAGLFRFSKAHEFSEVCIASIREGLFRALESNDDSRLTDILCHLDKRLINSDEMLDQDGKSLLYFAVQNRCSLRILEALLLRGSDPNWLDHSSTPILTLPLFWHDHSVALKVISLLLNYGANTQLKVSDTGQTLAEFAEENAISFLVAEEFKKNTGKFGTYEISTPKKHQ